MATVVLKTFKGGNVSPLNDAILWQTAIPGAGVFKGCEVTAARGNILHVSQGYGIIKGRFFEVYENEISVQLADTGQTLNGRLYLHMDLSNADEPIKFMTETGDILSSLLVDTNVNYNNSAYDLEMATFKVDAGGILNLTQVFPNIQSGSGSGGGGGSFGVSRDTAYEAGDLVTCANAPGWCILVCIQRGATALAEPVGYTQIQKGGDKVLDGTCLFEARNIIEELDNITLLQDDLSELTGIVEEMRSDTDAVTIKVMSLAAYSELETYSDKTIYYCYKDENSKEIVAIYLGRNAVYSTGVTVTYHIDEDTTTTKTYSIGDDAVASAPSVSLPGYTFVGWREDSNAVGTVLTEKKITTDEAVNLYAVFSEPVTVRFDANGGEGEIEDMSGGYFYNNGNEAGASIRLPKKGFTKPGYKLTCWLKGSTSGLTVAKGATVSIKDDITFYALWVKDKYEYEFRNETEDFIAPVDGIYKFTLYGAEGGAYIDTEGETLARGGLGGVSVGYLNLNRNAAVIVCVGGKGEDAVGTTYKTNAGGYNGGGNGTMGNTYCGAGGGGATHIAKIGGTLSQITKSKISDVYMIAGAGGGATYTKNSANQVTTYKASGGGYGGGIYGGNGKNDTGYNSTTYGVGGDPTQINASNARFGYGTAANSSNSGGYGGGGSGYVGGTNGNANVGGGGGCAFIDNAPEITYENEKFTPMTQGNVNEGDGHVEVELIVPIV